MAGVVRRDRNYPCSVFVSRNPFDLLPPYRYWLPRAPRKRGRSEESPARLCSFGILTGRNLRLLSTLRHSFASHTCTGNMPESRLAAAECFPVSFLKAVAFSLRPFRVMNGETRSCQVRWRRQLRNYFPGNNTCWNLMKCKTFRHSLRTFWCEFFLSIGNTN